MQMFDDFDHDDDHDGDHDDDHDGDHGGGGVDDDVAPVARRPKQQCGSDDSSSTSGPGKPLSLILIIAAGHIFPLFILHLSFFFIFSSSSSLR